MLMQVPEQDFIQTLDYAVPLMREQRADVYVFPNEPHIKLQPRHKLAIYERNLDWFRFWLQGFDDNDHRNAEPYAQWRAMRARQCDRDEPKRDEQGKIVTASVEYGGRRSIQK